MSEIEMTIDVPLDGDGFLALCCPFCKSNFKLKEKQLSESENTNLYCPNCGLINKINTFYTKDFYEKAKALTQNYAENLFYEMFKDLERKNRSNKSFKISAGKKPINKEVEIYEYVDNLKITHKSCCDIDIKIRRLDEWLEPYCPYCGNK